MALFCEMRGFPNVTGQLYCDIDKGRGVVAIEFTFQIRLTKKTAPATDARFPPSSGMIDITLLLERAKIRSYYINITNWV